VRKYLAILACSLLLAPVIALLIARGVDSRLFHDSRAIAEQLPGSLCEDPSLSQSSRCESKTLLDRFRSLAEGTLIAVAVLPAFYVGSMLTLRRRRRTLARLFKLIIRCTLAGLALILLAEGALLGVSSFLFLGIFDVPEWAAFIVPGLVSLIAALGLGLISAGVSTVGQWYKLFAMRPLDVDGVIVDVERIPHLVARVAGLASRLKARAPTRIIVGLNPRAFVTTAQIKLRGGNLLTREETLYLPLVAFRAFSDSELDALVGHELGHFRGEDLYFTERFGPAFFGLQRSLEAANAPAKGWMAMGRLPALLAITGMMALFLRVAGPIRQAREFEADQTAVEVSDAPTFLVELTKLTVLAAQWPSFAHAYGVLAHSGVGRRNLVVDFLTRSRRTLEKMDQQKFTQALLKARLAHPFDSHPTIAQRATALHVNAEEVIGRALVELMRETDVSEEVRSLEEEVTTIETQLALRPGAKLTIDDRPGLPPSLDVRTAATPVNIPPPAAGVASVSS
jgi:Zn-dependent protease with chaperone function